MSRKTFNVNAIKGRFPIFKIYPDLVYLDNWATTQKPQAVINSISDFYTKYNANIHRGIYELSEVASNMYEEARKKVASFIHANDPREIIFTSGTTQSLNLVASSWGRYNLGPDDVVISTIVEHHSNFIPWQQVCNDTGASFKVLNLSSKGSFDLSNLETSLRKGNVRLITLTHVSNVLGLRFPIKDVVKLAHKYGALVCVDGAQGVAHLPVNVSSLDVDFYAFSGHKMFGPTGVGVLYVNKRLWDQLHPSMFGGGMIKSVNVSDSTWADFPYCFEAGTPNIAGVIGLGVAVEFIQSIGMSVIESHERSLVSYGLSVLSDIPGVSIVGSFDLSLRAGVLSFTVKNTHAHDVASILSSLNVAVRSGHHCAQPLHNCLGLSSSIRASFSIYNSVEDIDKLAIGLKKAIKLLT